MERDELQKMIDSVAGGKEAMLMNDQVVVLTRASFDRMMAAVPEQSRPLPGAETRRIRDLARIDDMVANIKSRYLPPKEGANDGDISL